MTKFEKNLQNAPSESKYELCIEKRKTDETYWQLEKEYNQLFDRIQKRLGKN